MPDLVTHISFAWLFGKLSRFRYISLILIGAVLPDIFDKWGIITNILFGANFAERLTFSHTIPGIILISLITASFFKDYLKVSKFLLFGALSHLILDSFMFVGIKWLWPINWKSFGFHLFWQESLTPFIIINSIVIIFIISLFLKRKYFLYYKNTSNNEQKN